MITLTLKTNYFYLHTNTLSSQKHLKNHFKKNHVRAFKTSNNNVLTKISTSITTTNFPNNNVYCTVTSIIYFSAPRTKPKRKGKNILP